MENLNQGDIYRDECYEYSISLKDKTNILDQITQDFGIACMIIGDHTQFDTSSDPSLAMTMLRVHKNTFPNQSLWGCLPPMSNIKTVVGWYNKYAKFEGSDTDKLCRALHRQYIEEYKEKIYREYQDDER